MNYFNGNTIKSGGKTIMQIGKDITIINSNHEIEERNCNNETMTIDHGIITGNQNNITGKHNKIIGNDNKITGNHNKINGNHNICTGNHNKFEGNNNYVKGNHNKLFGKDCDAKGNYNKVNGFDKNKKYNDYSNIVTMSSGKNSTVIVNGKDISHIFNDKKKKKEKKIKYVQIPTNTELKHDKVVPEDSDKACSVCLDKYPICIITPCMHKILCVECSIELGGKDFPKERGTVQCPECRKDVKKIKRIFE